MVEESPRGQSTHPGLPEAADLRSFLSEAGERLAGQPTLLELRSKRVVVIGDTHGDVDTSRRATSEYLDEDSMLLFLGDYVDRGPFQIENLLFLLGKSQESPDKLFLLRGNHETPEMNRWYGFCDAVSKRYGAEFYENFMSVFVQLPVAAVVNGKMLALHGGIARSLHSIEQLAALPKGVVSPNGVYAEILWNDPDDSIRDFEPSPRGPGISRYGVDAVSKFLTENHLKAIVRSHEPRPNGTSVEMRGMVYTVFSCRYYGVNPGAMVIDGDNISLTNV